MASLKSSTTRVSSITMLRGREDPLTQVVALRASSLPGGPEAPIGAPRGASPIRYPALRQNYQA
jgi:hypothetical protein